jgi:hypothetical protein
VPNGRTGGEWHARRARSSFGDRAVADPGPRAEINAKIITAAGIAIPRPVLVRADKVIKFQSA